jgi:5-methylthioadenosine/S-adenosylhomocysteine deaminase
VDWLESTGLLACRPLLIHCVTAGIRDFEIAHRHGATVAHCPWSNAVLGHGRANLAAMRRAGVVVGLGTDSVVAGGRLDLFAEARVAALGVEGGLAPRELLRLVTADGAAALDLPSLGSLEPGAWGDLAAVGLAAPAFVPAADPEGAVAWGATAADVVFAAVAGRVVFQGDRWPGVDLEAERDAFARAVSAAAPMSRPVAPRGMFAGS